MFLSRIKRLPLHYRTPGVETNLAYFSDHLKSSSERTTTNTCKFYQPNLGKKVLRARNSQKCFRCNQRNSFVASTRSVTRLLMKTGKDSTCAIQLSGAERGCPIKRCCTYQKLKTPNNACLFDTLWNRRSVQSNCAVCFHGQLPVYCIVDIT